MTNDGIVVREIVSIAPPTRTVYRLTAFGADYAQRAADLTTFIDRHTTAIEVYRDQVRQADAVLA
jgi:DNA-binding HxlR family transcriptional regulator